jgi:nucleoside 2-deoxyribosyltransferase
MKPLVVCLCGSTRFRAEIAEANRAATMAGKIVLAPGVFGHAGDPLTDEDKARLDRLHLAKIDMADEVLVVNPEGYIGESTCREIEYATRTGKPVACTHNEKVEAPK